MEKRQYLDCVGSSSPLLIHSIQNAVPSRMMLLDVIKLQMFGNCVDYSVYFGVPLLCVCAEASPEEGSVQREI